MAEVVKKISMPLTFRSMKPGDVVKIPFWETRPSTVYNRVTAENIKCGWNQWKAKVVKDELGQDFFEIRRLSKDEANGNK